MKEYIEREKALDAISEWLMKALHSGNMSSYNEGERAAYRTALSEIAGIPAADVQEVDKLTEAGKSLLKYCPELINQLVARINDNMDRAVLYGKKREES